MNMNQNLQASFRDEQKVNKEETARSTPVRNSQTFMQGEGTLRP
jgi:hypothetical protein